MKSETSTDRLSSYTILKGNFITRILQIVMMRVYETACVVLGMSIKDTRSFKFSLMTLKI